MPTHLFDNTMRTDDLIVTLTDNTHETVFINSNTLGITAPSISFALYTVDEEIDGKLFTEADVVAALIAYSRNRS